MVCDEIQYFLCMGCPVHTEESPLSCRCELLRREEILVKAYHEANCANHEVAKFGRVHGRTVTCTRDFPPEFAAVINHRL
jgi:hypothetical protein